MSELLLIMLRTMLKRHVLCFFLASSAAAPMPAQQTELLPPAAVNSILKQAVQYQLDDFHHRGWGLQYRVHRLDSKEDSIREVIETEDGNISRTLTYKGRALTEDEEKGEQARLKALTSQDVSKRRQKSEANDKYGIELIRTLPQAMTFTPVAGQPQLPGRHQQLVLDFAPDPKFHPDSTTQSLLTGIAGRMWIDAETHHLTRIELRIVQNLNLMFGILARVYQGGTLSYEQKPVSPQHDAYTEMQMDVKLRELMFHIAPYRQTLTVTSVRFYPIAPTVKDAVDTLLAIPPVTP